MNRKLKSALALIAVTAMSVTTFAACGSSSSSDSSKGKVYYLNFKPEAADEWTDLAAEYTKETGVEVNVQTAASNTYEQQLKSEMAKSEAPTLFQVNGPVGYANWKNYTADMSGTEVYKQLQNQDVALKDGDKVVGVPYVMETYGLIYNKDILNKYFSTSGAKGEENQGLATGSENYWCINSKASKADQKATADFLKWVITSDNGKEALSQKMGFTTPFKTFSSVKSDNPLVTAAMDDQKSGTTAVSWNFTMMPSEQWKNDLGSALLEYAQGTGNWDGVKSAFVDGWAKEYANAHK